MVKSKFIIHKFKNYSELLSAVSRLAINDNDGAVA